MQLMLPPDGVVDGCLDNVTTRWHCVSMCLHRDLNYASVSLSFMPKQHAADIVDSKETQDKLVNGVKGSKSGGRAIGNRVIKEVRLVRQINEGLKVDPQGLN